MKQHLSKAFLLILAVAAISFSAGDKNKDYTGFSDANAKVQQSVETRFDSLVKASDIDYFVKTLSAHPHHLGSAGDKANVQFILQQYRSWGYDARIDTFYALFPTPKTRLLEAVSPIQYKALLQEPALKEDRTSSQTVDQLPTYNCYSADGDVTAELVYVNQGVPEDYVELDKMGISVKGKIVIVRYGGSWRGIKPRLAQEHGAIGCIIYSDPKDDGYYQGDAYPKGAYRSEYGVQRGSVADITLYPGDPLTPGYGDTKNAKRLDRKDATDLLKIPVLPISWHDAKPLLEAISGRTVPANWRGALPITYHVGPGPVKVHLKLEFNWNIVPVYDVIAMLKGTDAPDQWVIRGNHQDAWVNGADDPISGQAAMLGEAKVIGELAKEGIRPKRTIVYCSWDGEEEGLLGSTEWAETNAVELQQKAVAYINSDGTGRGVFFAGSSHSLQTMINEVAGDVTDPEMNISIKERRKAYDVVNASTVKEQKELLAQNYIKVDALGSGSDFSSFLQHLGIASMDIGFGGEDGGGEYHSIYDSYDMYERFKDPNSVYGAVLAKTGGRIVMRLANADILPFNFKDMYTTVSGYVQELTKKLEEMRASTEMTNELLNTSYYVYANDPTKTLVNPPTKEDVPFLDFSSLENSLLKLQETTEVYQRMLASNQGLSQLAEQQVNILIYQSERKLLLPDGLPNRQWYKHAIYAPGYYTGYGVKTLPGIREAIEGRKWTEAQQQIAEAAKVIDAYNAQITSAMELFTPHK
jgi:N-acetylated-alpha-linked acidic dipeptidase